MEHADNERAYQLLADIVLDKWIPESRNAGPGKGHIGPLEFNNFSICFGVGAGKNTEVPGVYVKIPKADLFLKSEKKILPLAEEDRRFGESEYEALVYLAQHWTADDLKIKFVKPLDYLSEFNAIVTERADGGDYFRFLRKADMLERFAGRRSGSAAAASLSRLGTALARFHKTAEKEESFPCDPVIAKILLCASRLNSSGLDSGLLEDTIVAVETFRGSRPLTLMTKTLKGLDVRNILIDRSENIFLLDPGRMKEDCREADLARFLVTLRILYWGSLRFFARLSPRQLYERSFLGGYYGPGEMPDQRLLILLTIKELLKHWHIAHVILRLKPWPAPLKNFLKRTYIDPFYKHQLRIEMARLKH
jgi:hypothetical protein